MMRSPCTSAPISLLTDNIEAAVKEAGENRARKSQCQPMEIPGRGSFAIYIQGGVQLGLWQL